MFARQYKAELIPELKAWEDKILTHWKAHKKPFWNHTWEERTTTATRHNFEIIVATIWITQGARGCTCYKKSPVLQDAVANYFMTRGSILACDVIINEELGNGDIEPNSPITKPRKLLL